MNTIEETNILLESEKIILVRHLLIHNDSKVIYVQEFQVTR